MVQFDKSCTLTFGTSWQDCGSDALSLKCTKVLSASQDEVLGRAGEEMKQCVCFGLHIQTCCLIYCLSKLCGASSLNILDMHRITSISMNTPWGLESIGRPGTKTTPATGVCVCVCVWWAKYPACMDINMNLQGSCRLCCELKPPWRSLRAIADFRIAGLSNVCEYRQ